MLDDLKLIHSRDAQDALGVAQKQWAQLTYTYNVKITTTNGINNVVVAGMGGSALAATLLVSWPSIKLPFSVVRDYDIPTYADKNTLFIASSYSGNTEETLSALTQAETKGCQIVVIASGGKLAEIAEKKAYPLYKIPEGYQPRMAVFYNFRALIELFVSVGLLDKQVIFELDLSAKWLAEQCKTLLADIPTKDNQAKQIARELAGNSIVVYAGAKFFPVAYKWKINFNENSKTIAWCNHLPEFNHNEFLGWTSHPTNKPYKVIDIRSPLENVRTQKRFVISEKLLSGKRPQPEVVVPVGETLLKQLLWSIQLGDFVSLYLAIINELNPTPVALIEKLKVEMAK